MRFSFLKKIVGMFKRKKEEEEVEGFNTVRDFIAVEDLCQYCARIKIAKALDFSDTFDFDIIDIFEGDPRTKLVEAMYKKDIYVPTGIINNTILIGSDHVFFMKKLFGG